MAVSDILRQRAWRLKQVLLPRRRRGTWPASRGMNIGRSRSWPRPLASSRPFLPELWTPSQQTMYDGFSAPLTRSWPAGGTCWESPGRTWWLPTGSSIR